MTALMGVKTMIKFGLHNSLVVPVKLYGFICITASRTEIKQLESSHKESFKWITGLRDVSYEDQLGRLNILHQNHLLFLSKMMNEDSNCIKLPQAVQEKGWKNDIFILDNKRTENARR